MKDGKRLDFGGHIEYPTLNPKKEKAADCIYLDEERICRNKKSNIYLDKCFRATWCPMRMKENENKQQKEVTKPILKKKMVAIPCSLPMGTQVFNKTGKKGIIVRYEPNSMVLTVKFYNEHRFLYPSCFDDGYLSVEEGFQSYIVRDKKKAIWE